jgi:formylglycine-generating enzyme required for sulfatase activity
MMEDFCTWVGAEVPTQAEYLLFGGYEQGVNEGYPWGGEPIECNRAHTAGCGLGTRPVDARPTGASPYDVYDPIGNVRKWTTTPARNGRVIVGCGWADQALDPDGIPVCTLVWTEVFLNQNTHSPDLGGYCIRRN